MATQIYGQLGLTQQLTAGTAFAANPLTLAAGNTVRIHNDGTGVLYFVLASQAYLAQSGNIAPIADGTPSTIMTMEPGSVEVFTSPNPTGNSFFNCYSPGTAVARVTPGSGG